jgi:LCP family protein required for cell wall assembly
VTRLGRGLVGAALILLVVACSGLVAGQLTPTPDGTDVAADPTPRPRRTPRPPGGPDATSTPTPRPPKPTPFPDIPGLGALTGSDGRLTVLILGSDARGHLAGERTDTIMLASINPGTGKVVMASLPRDTVRVPIADGVVYPDRINGLLAEFERRTGRRGSALRRMKAALAYAFDTEIDYYVIIGFRGFERLIDAIGGVQVRLKRPLIDPTMHIGKRGLRLRAGTRRLDGRTALAFSRTRHSDSDYERARRQQQVIAAAASRVLTLGPERLPALVALAGRSLETDMPLGAAPVLLALAGRADLARPKSVVLAPLSFATPGRVLYTIEMRVEAVRRMFDRAFGPVR